MQTLAERNELLDRIWSAQIGEQTRARKYYTELLEAQLRRYEQGRILGMWVDAGRPVRRGCRTPGPRAALLRAAFAGENAIPEPIRACPCVIESEQEPAVQGLHSCRARPARPPARGGVAGL